MQEKFSAHVIAKGEISFNPWLSPREKFRSQVPWRQFCTAPLPFCHADFHVRPDASFRALIQHIVARVNEIVNVLAWERGQTFPAMRLGARALAMVMRNWDHTIAYDHGEAHWSTVYYLDAGAADEKTYLDSGSTADFSGAALFILVKDGVRSGVI
ncbi:MAG: hypothetical protein ABI648_11120 [Betaproteobacteria bacterium]